MSDYTQRKKRKGKKLRARAREAFRALQPTAVAEPAVKITVPSLAELLRCPLLPSIEQAMAIVAASNFARSINPAA